MLEFSPLSATAVSELRARGPPSIKLWLEEAYSTVSSSFVAHRSHQLHHSMATPGGPLLTVGDMLRDLSEDSSGERLLNLPSFSASSPSGLDAATQNPKSGFAEEVLPKTFQVTYKQLDAALKQSGHTWTGLTQELCATLTTADKLVATAHSNLGELTQEVKRLQEVVERGQGAILKLHSNLGMVTNVPEPGRQRGR